MKIWKYLVFAGIVGTAFVACDEDEIELIPAVSFQEEEMFCIENEKTLQVPIKLSAPLKEAMSVYVTIVPDSEKGGEKEVNYKLPSRIYLDKESVRGNYMLQIIDDEVPNEDRSFVLEITSVIGGVKDAVHQRCTVNILDNDRKRNVTVGFQTESMDFNEDMGIIEVPVIVKGILSDSLFVNVTAESGSAIENIDFELIDKRIKIMERESWGVVRLSVVDYGQSSIGDRSFVLKIASVEGMNEQDTTVSIRKNAEVCEINILKVVREIGFPQKTIKSPEYQESVSLPIKLSAPIDKDVRVMLKMKEGATAIEGEHFTIDKKEFVIKRGDVEALAGITVINDRLGNDNRFCEFEISYSIEGLSQEEVNEYLSLSDIATCKFIIENEDSSLGFGEARELCWFNSNVRIPIKVSGLRNERLMVTVAAKANPKLVENKHYMILNKEVKVEKEMGVVYVEVAIMDEDIELGEFDLELNIIDVRGLDLTNNTLLDPVAKTNVVEVRRRTDVALNRSEWTVDYISEGAQDPDWPVTNLFDGSISGNGFWHTNWNNDELPYPKNPNHQLIVKMDATYIITEIEVVGRYTDMRSAIFYVSADKNNWVRLGQVGSAGTFTVSDINAFGSYLRIDILGKDSGKFQAGMYEVYVKGIQKEE